MRVLILVLGILLVSACNTQNEVHDGKTDLSEPVSTSSSEELEDLFLPVIKGVWVLSDYIDEVSKTKSPHASSNKLNGIVTLIIGSNVQGDSLQVGASLNNHEGYDFNIFFKQGQTVSSLQTNIIDYEDNNNRYEIGYEALEQDTSLVLYHYSNSNQLINKSKFSKVSNAQIDTDAGWGIQHVVNKKLFEGTYLVKSDSISPGSTIKLDSSGKMVGLTGYKSYYVLTDLSVEPFNDLDQICFDIQTKKQKCFAYKIKGDTINLYDTIEDEEQMLLVLGQLKYSLIRQKN